MTKTTAHTATSQRTEKAIAFGSSLLAGRLGLVGYQVALSAIKSLTSAKLATLIETPKNGMPRIIASTSENIEHFDQLKGDATEGTKSQSAHKANVQKECGKGARQWTLTLGLSEGVTASILLHTETDLSLPFVRAIEREAAISWQMGDGPRNTKDTKVEPAMVYQQTKTDLLGPDNPYGLTRSERRVCQLLRSGARPAAIATSTGTSISTIRTHLQRIYSKTDCSGAVEVLHLIGSSGATSPMGSSHVN